MRKVIVFAALTAIFVGCADKKEYAAEGTFEATEIIVSAEAVGRILQFDVCEGAALAQGQVVGQIDTMALVLQRKQLQLQQQAILAASPDVKLQVGAICEQISKLESEKSRVENLLKDDAATAKQLDDIYSQLAVAKQQLLATLSTLNNNVEAVANNAAAMETQIELLNLRIAQSQIVAPTQGTVLLKYAEAGEYASPGKPLMKVANLEQMYLRAYFTSDQLAQLTLGQEVNVVADFGAEQVYDYSGVITWIASDSEFTPKTIQTADTRANLVYAVKIAVPNDGRIKIGMHGKVSL